MSTETFQFPMNAYLEVIQRCMEYIIIYYIVLYIIIFNKSSEQKNVPEALQTIITTLVHVAQIR